MELLVFLEPPDMAPPGMIVAVECDDACTVIDFPCKPARIIDVLRDYRRPEQVSCNITDICIASHDVEHHFCIYGCLLELGSDIGRKRPRPDDVHRRRERRKTAFLFLQGI